jgi:hypothetical protein
VTIAAQTARNFVIGLMRRLTQRAGAADQPCRNCKKSCRFPTMSDVVRGMSVKSTLKGTTMSETNKANTVAFHKKAVFDRQA